MVWHLGGWLPRVDSGLNGNRARFGPGVVRPICQGDCCEASRSAGALWVAHLQAALAGQGRQVVVVDSGDTPR